MTWAACPTVVCRFEIHSHTVSRVSCQEANPIDRPDLVTNMKKMKLYRTPLKCIENNHLAKHWENSFMVSHLNTLGESVNPCFLYVCFDDAMHGRYA